MSRHQPLDVLDHRHYFPPTLALDRFVKYSQGIETCGEQDLLIQTHYNDNALLHGGVAMTQKTKNDAAMVKYQMRPVIDQNQRLRSAA